MSAQEVTVTKTATARVIRAADIEKHGSVEAARAAAIAAEQQDAPPAREGGM